MSYLRIRETSPCRDSGALWQYDIPDLMRAIVPCKVEFRNPADATGEHLKASNDSGSAPAELEVGR
jgi:hypothetical protein